MNHKSGEVKIPNPDTQLGVIKRYLHVLALLQNDNDGEVWTSSRLAAFIRQDEDITDAGGIHDKTIRDYISKYLEDQLDIEISRQKGSKGMSIAEDLDRDLLCRLLGVYSSFVVEDSQKAQALRVFADRNPKSALWLLARIYFAVKLRQRISFTYTNTKNEQKRYTVHPYFMAFRNNGLYLVCKLVDKGEIRRFVLNRVEQLEILDKNILAAEVGFTETIPTPQEVFAGSIGAYANSKEMVSMTIRYKKDVRLRIEDGIEHLDPRIVEKDEWVESTFSVSDVRTVCSQLLFLGSSAEIVAPPSARDQMRKLLEDALTKYT